MNALTPAAFWRLTEDEREEVWAWVRSNLSGYQRSPRGRCVFSLRVCEEGRVEVEHFTGLTGPIRMTTHDVETPPPFLRWRS